MKLVQLKIEGCQPCKAVNSFLTNTIGEDAFEVVDMHEEGNKEKYSDVRSVPVLILYDDQGEELNRVGGANFKQIKELIKEYE